MAKLAAELFQVPTALISFVEKDRQSSRAEQQPRQQLVRSTAHRLNLARSVAYRDLNGFDFTRARSTRALLAIVRWR